MALVALVAVAPALAEGPGPGKQLRCRRGAGGDCTPGIPLFSLVGIIRGVGDDASLNVEVYHGNRFAQPYIEGPELVVVTTEATEYQRWTSTGCVPLEEGEEVVVGDTTSIHGLVQEVTGAFIASRVTVDVPLDCCSQ